VSGPEARAIARRVARVRDGLRPRFATVAEICGADGAAIDRGIVLFMPGPGSATGEDIVEFHVHGSPVVAREVLQAAFAAGARLAEPGEFTRRAFLAGKLDLSAAEAVADLIAAESRSAARAAHAGLAGGLAREIGESRAQLAAILEELAAALDFPDEVPEPDRAALAAALGAVRGRVAALRDGYEVGRIVREGAPVAIVGPPNAGKSSLLNALLAEERAIVSPVPGTTRDTIEERIVVDGIALRLIDTAGLRETADEIEAQGVARSRAALESARLLVVVIDGSREVDAQAREILRETATRERVVLFNKADLGLREQPEWDAGAEGTLSGSVRWPKTLAELRATIVRRILGERHEDLERPSLANARQASAALAALVALDEAGATLGAGQPLDLLAGDLHAASRELAAITGEDATEALLDGIFARFCIGK
jgi:tRNA modification GTPase